MGKKKKLTLDGVAKKLNAAGAIHIPISEDVYLVLYTRTMFETIESQNNIFQPTSEKVKVFIPSYFMITTNLDVQKENSLSTAIFNIHSKTVTNESFVTPEIIGFFEEEVF